MSTEVLRKLYEHKGEYFVLVRPGGILIVEGPKEQERYLGEVGKEAALLLFMYLRDAQSYCSHSVHADAKVMRITLVGLWQLLERINALSMQQFQVPVRVDVCTVNAQADPVVVDTFHSSLQLPS